MGRRISLTALSLVAIASICVVDLLSGPEIGFSLFYLIPVVVTAWYLGRGPGRVEIQLMTYAQFRGLFPTLPGKTPLPDRNVCADPTRVVVPISGGAGQTTSVKFSSGQFNVGVQVPAKPSLPTWNCYVGWTRIIGDPSPGLLTLFTLT